VTTSHTRPVTAFVQDGFRDTPQRRAVAAAVQDLEWFSSAQQVHEVLRARGSSVGLSTVYRTLPALAAAGLIDSVRSQTGEVLYRKCAGRHHHHLVCRGCGRAVEVSAAVVEEWADHLASAHGYAEVTHSIEIFGLCPRCAIRPSVR